MASSGSRENATEDSSAVFVAAQVATFATPTTQSIHEKCAPYIAEFVGTFILVFTVGCCLMAAPHSAWNGMAIAAALTVAIYSMGPISGGHLNPAVSLAIWLNAKRQGDDDGFNLKNLLLYIAAQLVAGISAGFSFTTLFDRSASLNPGPTYGFWEVSVVETVFTAMLAFVVLNVACETTRVNLPTDGNQFFAIAIGFVVVTGAYAAGPISGAVFNPAVAIGIEISNENGSVLTFFKYVLFQCVGSVIAVVLYRIVRPDVKAEDDYKLATKMASQFIGTWFITFSAGLAVLTASVSGAAPVWPLAAGACYMCMSYALGDICNGFFNPAVTLAFMLGGRSYTGLADGIALIIMQFSGGLAAAFVYAGLGEGSWVKTYHTFPIEPSVIPHKWVQNCAGEMAFTGLIAFVALGATSMSTYQSVSPNYYKPAVAPAQMRTMWQTGLAVGLSYLIGGVAMDLLGRNGGMLNPAVTLGAATANAAGTNHCWLCAPRFLLYEFSGAVVAAGFFRIIYAEECGKASADSSETQ